VVVCVTEGGETSSVIGTVLAARRQYEPGEARDRQAAPVLRLQQPRRGAAPLRPQPRRARRAGHHQAVPGDRPAGDHRLDPHAGDHHRDLRARRGHGDRRRTAARRAPRCGDPAQPRLRARAERWPSDCATASSAARRGRWQAVPALAQLTEQESETYRRGGFATYLATERHGHGVHRLHRAQPDLPALPAGPRRRARPPLHGADLDSGGRHAPAAWQAFLGARSAAWTRRSTRRRCASEVDDPYLRRAGWRAWPRPAPTRRRSTTSRSRPTSCVRSSRGTAASAARI
jgi:hypothetical protein